MEKKIWTMPQVSVQEFAPNEYMAACTYQVHGECHADDHYWWRWNDSDHDGAVDYSGRNRNDEISGFWWNQNDYDSSDYYSHLLSSNQDCDDTKESDGYVQASYNRVAGVSKTQWTSFTTGLIGISDLLWKTGYAIMSWGGLTSDSSNFGIHVYTSMSSKDKS